MIARAEGASVLGVNNMLIVPSSADPDKVEAIVKSIFDNMEEFQAENANAKQIDPEMSKSLAIDLHEGAARYFQQ
ncbi:MAG: TAXI family TRAP transporter solute-binding subunit [Pseudomonadota bacterium]